MSEQAEQISGEPGSARVEPMVPHSSDASIASATAGAETPPIDAESPGLVPEQSGSGETPAPGEPKAEAEAAEETIKDTAQPDAPRMPGSKVMIMSAADRAWANDDEVEPETESEPSPGMFGKRRISALAAVVVLAAVAGAIGGATATVGLQHFAGAAAAPVATANTAFDTAVERIDSDIAGLKASVEHTSKMGLSQFNKTSDRLDKLEKAQAEPAAKIAKLSETVEKLHAAPPAPVAAAAPPPKEVTGSVTPPSAAAAPKAEAKVEVGRLPTIDGWILRDVANGGALIEGRQGIFEVYAGDPVPGLGRVDAIRRQDGRWVVVTSKGLIVAR